MKIKNKYIIVSIFIIISAFICTYAYFATDIFSDLIKNTTMISGKIEMSISDESVNVQDLAPIYDETYNEYAYSKSFSIKSIDEGLNVCSKLYLNISYIDTNLISKYFKWKIVSSDGEEYTGNFKNAVNGEKLELLSGIYFKPGQTKTYTMYIWLSYEENINQTIMLGGELKSSLYIEGIDAKTRNSCENITLVNSILFDNDVLSDSDKNNSGLYVTNDLNKTQDIDNDSVGEKVYYFYGDVKNNYVKFDNNLYRIIKINEDGSVRLMLDSTNLRSKYNTLFNDNAYLGFMIGINEGNSTSYGISVSNKYDSFVKTILDEWYSNNIVNESYIVNNNFCNDRSLYSGNGFSNNETIYNTYNRFINNNPQYKCISSNDNLNISVGLITIDEMMFAGYFSYNNGNMIVNNNNFLNKTNPYLTMSPYNYIDGANVFTSIGFSRVDNEFDIYPVININGEVNVVFGGDGSLENPYIIE